MNLQNDNSYYSVKEKVDSETIVITYKKKERSCDICKSVMDRLPKKHQFEFVMFAERLRTTMLCSIEPITKTSLKKG